MPTVHLHIGAMKSGTTYLQEVLGRNRDVLQARGVLFPGPRWHHQVIAAEDLVGRRPKGKPDSPEAWQRLVDEVLAFEGSSVIISMETLAMADAAAARRAVESFGPNPVQVVLTARDLGRVIPAQWQESMQNGGTTTYERFLATASATRSRTLPVARILWAAQDLGHILRTWAPFVPAANLTVVTVPPAGSDPTLLWRRFGEAVGLDPSGFDTTAPANESLGATSAELMRQVNVMAKERKLPWATRRALKVRLAKRVLPARRAAEPVLVLPDKYLAWARRSAEWQIDAIESVAPRIVGDLDELRLPSTEPVGGSRLGRRSGVDTAAATDSDLLQAALDGLVGLAGEIARRPRRP